MTKEELHIIRSDEFRALLETHLNDDPVKIALSNSIPHAALLATQVKYLQKARKKLPSYYAVRAVMTQKLFEQSSSELSSANKHFEGTDCVDLTCGLGVDSLYLSKNFSRVISVERDEIAAEIARINFKLLGADNIEVVCDSAENFINICPQVDTIYVDPDRRDGQNKKLAALEDCSPNIVALKDAIMSKCRRFVIKSSPLYDVDEAFKVFGNSVRVNVISVGGECKEVLIELCEEIRQPLLRATSGEYGHYEIAKEQNTAICTNEFNESYKYLFLPDVALRKARMADAYMASEGIEYFENNGIGLGNNMPDSFLGKCFETARIVEYKPKQLRSLGVRTMEIMKMNFPFPTAQICKDLRVKEGGCDKWMFCKLADRLWAIEIKELTL